ncbi:MAG: thiamine-phosphate kinase [Vicinamibacterales bacterium]
MPDAPSRDTVADLGEAALIARIRARVPADPPGILIGIGDDAAVLAPDRGASIVVTTDSLVEDVHFRRGWSSPEDVGHKALAVNLSDLAAMGAAPRAALLSLALPADYPVADLDALLDGLLGLAGATGTALVGGNITRSPGPLVVDVTAIGTVRPRRVLTRSGGRPGDELYVTGWLGQGAAALAWLVASVPIDPLRDYAPPPPPELTGEVQACLDRYRRPTPRLRLGRMVAGNRAATACMDLSDGLADAAAQIAGASGTGVRIEAAAIPVAPGARSPEPPAWRFALAGGDDYELLFAVAPRRRRAFLAAVRHAGDVPVTRVGVLTRKPGNRLIADGSEADLPRGFAHFA